MSVVAPAVHTHFDPSAEPCRFAAGKVDLLPLSLDLDDHTELLSSITSALISLSSFSQDPFDSGETESFSITPFRPKSAKLRSPHARRFRVTEGSKALLKQAILASIREKAKEDFAERVKRDMANLATTLGIDPELLPEFRRRMDAARQRGYKGYSPIYSRSSPCDPSPDQENGLPSRGKRSVIRMSRSFGFTKENAAVVEANVAEDPSTELCLGDKPSIITMARARKVISHVSEMLSSRSKLTISEVVQLISPDSPFRRAKNPMARSSSQSWLACFDSSDDDPVDM